MLKNYYLVTLRNLRKNGIYSFINITGLSIGIACSLMIMLWVFDEISFDKFHPKADRLYQVYINAEFDGKINSWNSLPQPSYMALKTEDNSIKNTVITDWGGERLFSIGDNRLRQESYFVTEEFLEMFEFPLIHGNAETVLDEPYSIVITESMGKRFFGEEDPLNKTIRVNNQVDLVVTGILKDIPSNSTFQFDCLMTWETNMEMNEWVKNSLDNWGNNSFQVFMELDDPANKILAEDAIRDLITEHGELNPKKELFLHPMTRWRLHSEFENGVEAGGMIEYVNMFTIIAAFILIIACINFMNLATARSERRAKEVGIRKCVGSQKRQLVTQFLGESFFISIIGFVIAILITLLLLPLYNDLVEKQLFINFTSFGFWIFAVSIIFLTGIISGSYPALYLSSFEPVKVLKGKIKAGKSASLPRKVLVTLQFGFSILLIIGTIVVYEQIQLVKSRQLGYNKENLITVSYNTELDENYRVLKNELISSGAVEAVTKSNSPITSIYSNNFLAWPGMPEDLRVLFTTIATEYDYTETMGIKLLEGRDFSEEFPSDSSAIIVNKAGIEVMGLKDPIGAELDLWGDKRTLIGVVDNVLMGSPYQEVRPMMMVLIPDWVSAVTLRLKATNDLQASLKTVEEIFQKYNPSYPFEYEFVDVEFEKKFTTISMTGTLANLFALLAILITCLGLFGLAAFTAEQRTKEIGVRKVLGASVTGIVALMCRDFSRLVILAFLISAPIAWYLLNSFLERRYPIHVEIQWWIFAVTGIVALFLALIVVASQALKAAYNDPVKSLRSE